MNGNYGYAGGKIRVIRNAAWVLFVTLLFAIPAQAQIAADPNAPAGQRPTVLTAPNGTPLINITTPSAGGVSVNQYKQLDVNANGAILNNSAGNVQTQLGGWVSGNPWLAAGSARIIVNQVNSSSPSQINGYVEVAGKRAEVVIANPSGISVNGGGFINASRVTLGTGIPQYDASGNLVSLLVQTGTVSINGAGLDLSGTDFAAIMGQAVEVNAAIWANDLKVVAGANKVGSDISGESLALSAVEGSNPAPVFILDVSALGGMYANHIFMVGTEAGFGVRNAGHISSTGKLVVTSEGRLENTGTLEAQSVQLAAASDIDNRGGTIRQNSSAALTVTAPALSNTQGGWIGAQPPATPDDGGAGSSNPSGDGAGSADSGDTSGAGSGGTGIGDITITPADPGSLTAGSAILNDGGKIYAGGPITLQTPQIDNSGGSLAVANMDVSGQSFSNAGGTLRVSQAFKADVAQFDNSGGTFQAGQSFTANVGQFINSGGTLDAGSVAVTASGNLLNDGGHINSSSDTTLNLGGTLDNSGGVIATAGDLGVRAGNVNNAGTGSLRAEGGVNLKASGAVANDGSITAGGDLNIAAGSVQSTAGGVLAAGLNADGSLGGSGNMAITTTDALAAHGTHLAAGNASLQGGSVDLSGSQTGAANITVTASSGNIVTSNATVATSGELNIRAEGANQALVNEAGALNGGQVTVVAGSLNNTQGAQIAQTGAGTATVNVSGGLNNDAGVIASNDNLAVNSGSLDNGSGSVRAENNLDLNVSGETRNEGSISAGNDLNIAANSVQSGTKSILAAGLNADGSLGASGNLSVTANNALQSQGTHLAAGNASLNGASVDLSGSQTGATNIAITAASGNVTTSHATVAASGALNIAAGNADQALVNEAGTLSGGQVAIKAGSLNNTQGAQIAQTGAGTATIDVGGAVNNDAGVIVSNGSLAINTGSIDNGSGSLRAEDDLDLNASGAVNNSGSITAGKNLNIAADSVQSGAGSVLASGLNADGSLGAGGDMNVTANGTLKTGGINLAAGDARLQGANVDLSGSQTGAASATITANSGNVVTSNATVATSGALTIEAANSPNQQLVNQTGALNGGQISIRAGSIDNTRGGQIVQTGTGTGTINAGSTLNNDTGAIVSNGGLAISADNIANGSGSIGGNGAVTLQANTLSNGDGVISAADGLSITASTLAGSGSYIAGNDLSLALQGDFENDAANAFSAGRNFTFAVTGALLNSGTLSAGNNLHLSASDITNNGSISAGGLLSSRSATLTNRGTIVGGSVSLAASSKLTNTGTRALIGATDSAGILELLSPVIENRDDVTATDTTPQTTIIGMGDVVLAGGKNDDGSYRNAGSILNQSALIQSGGNMLLGSDLITNTRRVLTTTDTYTEAISADLLASLGISLSGRTGVEGVADPDSIGGVYSDPPHGGQWNSTYMYTIYQGVAASNKVTAISPESQIIAGGDLDASSSGLFQNYWSRVAAGGNIAKPVMLDQNSWQGQLAPSVRVIYTGAYHYHNYDYSIPDWTRTFCLSGCYVNYADIRYYALPSYESSFTARGTIYGGGSIDNTAGNAGLPDLGIVPGQSLAGIGGTVAKANAGNVSGNVDTVTAANAGSVPDSSNPITTVRTAKMPDGSNPVATARAVNKPDSGSTVAAAGGGNITGSPVVTATSGNLPDSSNPVIAAATAGNVLGNLTVPQGGLFSLSPDSSYLIETNPAFADYRQWLSSDYYFQLMGVDPQRMQKRLGDGFYEQQLVQSQILSLTGRAVLGGYADTQSQFTALLEAGAALAKELNLEPGLSLSATQVAALTSDVIIMQTAIVDGQEVMVPVVYLARVNQKDMSGPVIAANDINLGNAGTLTNSGIIRADNSLVVNADSINNQYGTLQSGGLMALTTAGNIDLTSSTVKAGSLYLDAGNDLLLNTAVNTANYTGPHSTVTTQRLGPQASIDVAGDALIQVGGNFEQQGANLSAGGNAVVVVGGNWNLGTVQSGEIKDIRYSDNNSHTEYLSNTGSSVNVGGNLVAQTGGNLNLTGSSISAGGSATLAAANINLNAATDVTATQSDSHSKDHAETKNIRNETLIGSAIVSGGDLTLSAQNDVNVNASALQSGATLAVAAGNDINIGAQTETHIYESTHVGTRSNVLHSSMSAEADSVHTTNSVGSTVSGNTVTLSAGNDMKVTGSDVTSQLGTTLSAGNDLTIESSTDTSQSSQFRQEKTSGLMAGGGGISIGSNQASADAATATTTNRASTVGSTEGNVTLLAGNQYTQTGSNVSAPNGDVLIAAQNIVVQESQDTHSVTFNQKQSASGLSVGSSGVSLGNAKGQGNGTQTTSTAVGSTIEGKTVTLLASGGGEDSNITIQGSHLSGTDNVAVIAENQVKVLAARDTVQTTTGEENNFSGISLKPESISLKNLAKNDLDANSNTAVVSTLTSSEGSVLIHGGGTVVLEGTQVNAKKDINIEGGDVVIAAATNTQNTDATSSSKSLGMSVVNTVYNKAAESINPKKDTEGVTSETTLTRATLNGENVNITADDTLLMSGTTINAPGATTLNADTLIMGTQTSEKISQESSQGSDTMYQKIKDEGSQDQTIEYNQINTGTLAVNANQITVEMNAKESIEALGKQPGMEWVQQLENDPVLQSRIDWQQLEEVHKNWDYSHQGLTPEGAAIVVVVVTYLTWGTASEAGAAAVNATGSTAIGSAVTAGVSSLSSMASVSLINNQGNIGKTLKDLGSSENVKNLLTAMVTAGVLSGMNLQQPGTPTAGLSTDRFMTQLKANLTASATRALISTAINGGSLEDALKSGMKNALIDTVAAQGANWIGVNTDADSFSKYAAHAIAGCAEGAARTNGSCSAGALGAALGEAAATFYNSGRTDDDLISNGPYPGTIQFAAMISSIGEAIAGGNANGISLAGSAGANAAANNYSATVWLSAFKRVVVAKGLSEALSICARSSACMLAVSAGYLLLAPSPIAVGKGESTDEIIELHPCGNSLCAITDKQIDVVSRNPNVPPQVFLKADLQDYLIIPPYNAEDANRWVAGLVGMGIPIEAVKDIFTNEFPIADSSLIDQAISNIQQNGGKNGASNGNGGAAQSNLPPDTYGTPPNGAAPPPEGDEEKKAATGVTNYNEVRQVIRANAEPYGNTSNFNVASDVELQNLYDELTKVSQPVEVPGYNGVWRELADGTRIGLRNTSKTGGRAIDVKPPIQGDQFVIHIAP